MLAIAFVVIFFASATCLPSAYGQEDSSIDLDRLVLSAFSKSADGYSVDEVLIDDVRRSRFLESVHRSAPDSTEREIHLTLLRLRKTGKIDVRATRRGRRANENHRHAAEIAARITADVSGCSTDQMVADPDLRKKLMEEAQRVVPSAVEYDILKHVLGLRKARQLKPELVLRVAQWKREILVWPLDEIAQKISLVPQKPGVYLFRSSKGYLYIGEAVDLRRRLNEHLQINGESPLSSYLNEHSSDGLTVEVHAFEADSPAKKVSMRRAYESELIRSREPRLNIRP